VTIAGPPGTIPRSFIKNLSSIVLYSPKPLPGQVKTEEMNNVHKLVGILALDFLALSLTAITSRAQTTPIMPTFFARRDYSAPAAQSIQVADVNGDGIPDIVVNGVTVIDVMLGNGDGTFRPGPSSKTAVFGISNFALADLNGDGTPDLVVVGDLYNGAAGGIGVSFGNRDGTFSLGTFYQAGSGATMIGIVIGDFTGDGVLDIVAVGNGGVWLFTGQGGGTFDPGALAASLSASPSNLAAADLNGDNKLDLVMALQGAGAVVLFGNGNGTFQSPLSFTEPLNSLYIAVGSLTKGGPPSIILGNAGVLWVYYGNGAGKFFGPYSFETQENGGAVAIADVNGDGYPDLVSAGVFIYFGTSEGKFTKPYYYPIQGSASPFGANGLAVADLRNDGRMDIITNGGGVSVLLSETKGLFEDGIWTGVTGGAGCGVAADFNRDGKPDLAVNTPSGVSILLGTGKYLTPFTAGTPIALAGADCLVTGDINNDGIPDLLVPVNGTVVAYLGNGNGTFTLASTTSTPSGGFLVLGDFNHDGKLDFATSGNLIALGNGNGTFKTPTAIMPSPPDAFSGIAVGDINNDGWPDLVLTSAIFPIDANVVVLLNNQKGGFTQVPTSFGALTHEPILADLNGDGNLDLILSQSGLLFTDPSIYGASVFPGNGAGGFTFSQTVGGQTLNPTLNLVADFNGDGIPDILELENDTLGIYLGEGNATYAAPIGIGTGPFPGSLVVENLHGQSPSAGLPDIVVPDTSGGVMTLFNLTSLIK
jgi:hypothetical protein